MKLKLFTTALFIGLLTLPLQGASALEQTLASMSGTEANFTHKFLARGFKKEQIERGKVIFGSTPRMRWQYSNPEPKEFVFDGLTSWLYTPSEQQVVVSQLSEEERRALPFLFLNDAVATRTNFVITERRSRGATTTTLTSKKASDNIRQIVITAGDRDRFVRKLEYSDRGGNRTTFEFSAHRRRTVPAGTFQFTPPAGVDVVRN